MTEVRKLPEDELLDLAMQVEEFAASLVDARFAKKVESGAFDHLAAEALRELKEGKTLALYEVLDEHGIS